jgi:NAD(P)-dependent dehydrogenase (short-subunit alcohol dehydrogenase family)
MKAAMITGGTSGIGLAIAKGLLEKQYKVHLIGRTSEKGKAIETALNAQYPGNAKFIQLDLSNVSEVKIFSKQFLENQSKLDVLANVAGVMEPKREITKEGFEKTFAIGYLSAFVLSTQLAPLLENAPHGRILNVAGVPSFVFKARVDFEDMEFSANYNSFRTAITTVHAKTVLTEILSKKFASNGIDVNSFHPGAVRSDLMKNMPWWGLLMGKLLSPFMLTTCKTGIYVCSSPEIQGISGKFFKNKKAINLDFDTRYKERLWQETEGMIGRV